MSDLKDQIIAAIEDHSMRRVGRLAGELVRARPEDKEVILAERDFHLWLADTCRECLEPIPPAAPWGSDSGSDTVR